MDARSAYNQSLSLRDAERWLALGSAATLFLIGTSRRSTAGAVLAASSVPLLYRGITGRWPGPLHADPEVNGTRTALTGDRGVHVREAIRLEVPLVEVYGFWRRLENLPRFMTHLDRVTETTHGRSHWVAIGPAGLRVEWDAEIINAVDNELIAWQSLPDSDVLSAGSVRFDSVRGGRTTQVSVHLQYAPPAGKTGAFIASLFGREPSQTVREDLRHLKHLLEAGEIPRATTAETA
jgi:uncharacterized membrane protein